MPTLWPVPPNVLLIVAVWPGTFMFVLPAVGIPIATIQTVVNDQPWEFSWHIHFATTFIRNIYFMSFATTPHSRSGSHP